MNWREKLTFIEVEDEEACYVAITISPLKSTHTKMNTINQQQEQN